MKKLIAAAALAAGLAFPLTSQADVNAFGVSLPIEKREVSDNARGGYVAQGLNDTFQVQKQGNDSKRESGKAEYGNTYSVFGVHLSGKNVI